MIGTNAKKECMDSFNSRYNGQNKNGNSNWGTLSEILRTPGIEKIRKKTKQKGNGWQLKPQHDEKEATKSAKERRRILNSA